MEHVNRIVRPTLAPLGYTAAVNSGRAHSKAGPGEHPIKMEGVWNWHIATYGR